MIPLSVDKVREIQESNRRGQKIERLEDSRYQVTPSVEPQILNVVGEESITRFDTKRSDNNRRKSGDNRGGRRGGDRRKNSPNPNPNPKKNTESRPSKKNSDA